MKLQCKSLQIEIQQWSKMKWMDTKEVSLWLGAAIEKKLIATLSDTYTIEREKELQLKISEQCNWHQRGTITAITMAWIIGSCTK